TKGNILQERDQRAIELHKSSVAALTKSVSDLDVRLRATQSRVPAQVVAPASKPYAVGTRRTMNVIFSAVLGLIRGGCFELLLESYRVMRSNVLFAAVDSTTHSIVVTSTAPGEGKSLTASNLAVAMALDGKRVILVDADLRRPTIHEKFDVQQRPGVTNVLVG